MITLLFGDADNKDIGGGWQKCSYRYFYFQCLDIINLAIEYKISGHNEIYISKMYLQKSIILALKQSVPSDQKAVVWFTTKSRFNRDFGKCLSFDINLSSVGVPSPILQRVRPRQVDINEGLIYEHSSSIPKCNFAQKVMNKYNSGNLLNRFFLRLCMHYIEKHLKSGAQLSQFDYNETVWKQRLTEDGHTFQCFYSNGVVNKNDVYKAAIKNTTNKSWESKDIPQEALPISFDSDKWDKMVKGIQVIHDITLVPLFDTCDEALQLDSMIDQKKPWSEILNCFDRGKDSTKIWTKKFLSALVAIKKNWVAAQRAFFLEEHEPRSLLEFKTRLEPYLARPKDFSSIRDPSKFFEKLFPTVKMNRK